MKKYNFYIYGNGSFLVKFLGFVNTYMRDLNIKGLITSDNIEGYKCIQIENLTLQSDDKIIIMSVLGHKIEKKLLELGFAKNKDFFNGKFLMNTFETYELIDDSVKLIEELSLATQKINLSKLIRKKTSDTLFILGSGKTINEISDETWHQIEKNDSWGMNYSLLHKHIPTYYTFEFAEPHNRKWFENLVELVSRLNVEVDYIKEAYRIKDNNIECLKKLKNVPILYNMYKGMKDYEDFYNFQELLNLIGDVNFYEDFYYSYSSSVITTMRLAIKMGYKNIVFCGVELINNDYFFEQDISIQKELLQFLPPKSPDKVHPTYISEENFNNSSNVIALLGEYFSNKYGLQLYTMTEKSALFNKLPLYID